MLRFAVFDDDGPAATWILRHAHIIGQDGVPAQADIRFENGLIICQPVSPDACGLCMQYPIASVRDGEVLEGEDHLFGHVSLCTSILPDRDEPYLLSLELARGRIRTFLNKIEDWDLFDLCDDDPIMTLFESARKTFTQALVAQRKSGGQDPSPLKADRLARDALALAVEAGEQLALRKARELTPARLSGELYAAAVERYSSSSMSDGSKPTGPVKTQDNNGVVLPGKPLMGCTVNPAMASMEFQSAVAEAADFVRIPMSWVDMEPEEGKYSFTKTDRWIEWAVRKANVPLVGGPVIDFRSTSIPDWLYIWENDYETMRDLVYEHIRHIITRYRRTVRSWVIVSGMAANDGINFGLEQIMDLTRICVLATRKLHPAAKVYVEISRPWAEYHASSRRSLPPLLYAEMIQQAGIPIDGLALRLQMGDPQSGQVTRDLMSISDLLDRYARLGFPITVTAMGVPSKPPERDTIGIDGEHDPGFWREPWSEQVQADWLRQAMAIAASKPFVGAVCWQALFDSQAPSDMHCGGLIGEDGVPKPALQALKEVRQAIRAGRSPLDESVGVSGAL